MRQSAAFPQRGAIDGDLLLTQFARNGKVKTRFMMCAPPEEDAMWQIAVPSEEDGSHEKAPTT